MSKYIIQHDGLTPMTVEADRVEIAKDCFIFISDDNDVYFAPFAFTKYIMVEGKAARAK